MQLLPIAVHKRFVYLVSEVLKVYYVTQVFHGCVKLSIIKRIIEFGFLKLYIEFRKDGIGKYFKTKI